MELDLDCRLITCILPKGKAFQLQQALVEERGIHTGNFHYGRGIGRESTIMDRGIGEQEEREMFEVVVAASQADELFEFMLYTADMVEPHGGIIYITKLPFSNVMQAPVLADESEVPQIPSFERDQ